jgi:hypothetical protein
MLEFAFAIKDVPLARTALKKNRQGEKSETSLTCAQECRRRIFVDIPLSLRETVMAFPGGGIMGNFEFIAVDADLSLDQCPRARVVGKTHCYSSFCHRRSFDSG